MRIVFALFLAVQLSFAAAASTELDRTPAPIPTEATFGPIPDFVEPVDIGEIAEAPRDIYGAARYILVDDQHDARVGQKASYRRLAMQPVNANGITEAATWETQFNPAFQTLVFHHVHLIRDGQLLDRRERSTIEFARLETDMASQIFNGEATAILRVDDVRVGDVVDVAYTIYGSNPAFDGRGFREFLLNYGVEVEEMNIRSIWDRDQVRFWEVQGGDPDEVDYRRRGNAETFSFNSRDREAVDLERGAPAWVKQYPTLQISGFADWSELAAWGRPFFEMETPDEVVALAAQFRSEYDTPEEQLIAALRFVQDEIRYLAITYGMGSYVPAAPADTLEMRYGDCKAKTVLFMQLARELGFEADAALVSLALGQGLTEWMPSPGIFDHVIVRIMHEGESYYLDPTQSYQGGQLENITTADYGYALPLDGEADALVDMERAAPDGKVDPTIIINEVIDISGGRDAPVTLVVETIYNDMEADSFRFQLASAGLAGVERSYLDFYNRNFGWAEYAERVEVEDDRDGNRIIVRENVILDQPYETSSDNQMYQFAFLAHGIAYVVDPESQRRRTHPLAIAQPAHARHTVEMILTDGGRTWELENTDLRIENAGFRFAHTARHEGERYVLSFERTTLTDRVAAEDALEVLREHEDVMNALYYGVEMPINPLFNLQRLGGK